MKRSHVKILSIFLVLLILCSCGTPSAPAAPSPAPSAQTVVSGEELTIIFIDVGQADSALIMCGGQSMLIDGGNVADASTVVAHLKEQNIETLDYIVCTHAHEDHVGGLSGALNACKANAVLSPVDDYDTKAFSDFKKYAKAQNLELVTPEPGDTYSIGGAVAEVLGPVREYEDTNNTSIVIKLTYGETSFLFTGDAERDSELDIIDAGFDLDCDVLKVGHHGSSTSSSYVFLNEVMPEYAVISCGVDNSYGHPHDEVMSRLRDADVKLYRTDLQGDVICVSDGKNLTFTTDKSVPDSVLNPVEYGPYIGNKNSKVFHRDTCSGLPAEKNQVTFSSREEAVSSGYTACGSCRP